MVDIMSTLAFACFTKENIWTLHTLKQEALGIIPVASTANNTNMDGGTTVERARVIDWFGNPQEEMSWIMGVVVNAGLTQIIVWAHAAFIADSLNVGLLATVTGYVVMGCPTRAKVKF